MFLLYDTFNNRLISRHRTVLNAMKASQRHNKIFKANGQNSYIPTEIRNNLGQKVSENEIIDCERYLH